MMERPEDGRRPPVAGGEVRPLADGLAPLASILVAAMVVTPVLVGLLRSALPGEAGGPAWEYVPLLLQEGALLGLTLWRFRRIGEDWLSTRPLVEDASQAVRGIGWGVVLLFVNAFGSVLASGAVRAVAGPEALARLLEREQASVMRLLDPSAGPLRLGVVVFIAAGLAPVVEEIFFRGYAYRVLKHHAGAHAIWLSALLFASVHLYVVNFVPVFLIGAILAHAYERTGSLAVPIIAHATVNGLVAVVTVAFYRTVA